MKRTIFAIVASMVLALLALAPLDVAHAATWPTEGPSIGDGVRLRSAPSAKGTKNIVGKLDKEDTVLVFGEVFAEDET
ncbi:MAG: hypothetical protein IJR14_02760 [Synergistaceae bacterium]|nr:hypothetical protein [Synergistaceae bacterium]